MTKKRRSPARPTKKAKAVAKSLTSSPAVVKAAPKPAAKPVPKVAANPTPKMASAPAAPMATTPPVKPVATSSYTTIRPVVLEKPRTIPTPRLGAIPASAHAPKATGDSKRFNYKKRWAAHFAILLLALGSLTAMNVWLLRAYKQAKTDENTAKLQLSEVQVRETTLQSELSKIGAPERQTTVEANDLVRKVSQVIDLPTGERPSVVTVTEAEALRPQAFFRDAENGDKVLIYTTAQKAYLYRPSTGKIVNYGPVAAQSPTPTPKPTANAEGAQEGSVEGASTQSGSDAAGDADDTSSNVEGSPDDGQWVP